MPAIIKIIDPNPSFIHGIDSFWTPGDNEVMQIVYSNKMIENTNINLHQKHVTSNLCRRLSWMGLVKVRALFSGVGRKIILLEPFPSLLHGLYFPLRPLFFILSFTWPSHASIYYPTRRCFSWLVHFILDIFFLFLFICLFNKGVSSPSPYLRPPKRHQITLKHSTRQRHEISLPR